MSTTMLKNIIRGDDKGISLLNVEQIATLLDKSTDWVKDEIKAKRLPGGLIGREYRVTKAALQQFLVQKGL